MAVRANCGPLRRAALVADRSGAVVVWNRALEELTGKPAAEVLGKKVWSAFFAKKRATPVETALRTAEAEEDACRFDKGWSLIFLLGW